MALSLRELKAVSELAQLLYDFLPGSGSAGWKGHVSFQTIASKVGVGDFWQPGSKLPAIDALLQRTLEYRRGQFERLILEIVRAAIIYRHKQNRPITPQDIEQLNGSLLGVNFKFPDLWDPQFITSLRLDNQQIAKKRVEEAIFEEQGRANQESQRSIELHTLQNQFYGLHGIDSPQKAGFAFEKILNRLFALHGLAPREPFRVVGEQIDGSFELDYETYLVEAKWEKSPISEASLLIFRGKIEGKSAFTRGVFISLNGITAEAQHAIRVGKQPTFFAIDGYDLSMIFGEEVGLIEFLRQRRRLLADEGLVVVPFPQLWVGYKETSEIK